MIYNTIILIEPNDQSNWVNHYVSSFIYEELNIPETISYNSITYRLYDTKTNELQIPKHPWIDTIEEYHTYNVYTYIIDEDIIATYKLIRKKYNSNTFESYCVFVEIKEDIINEN